MVSCCLSAAFSASSRRFGLDGSISSLRRKISSAIMVASRYAIPSLDQYGPGFRYTQGAPSAGQYVNAGNDQELEVAFATLGQRRAAALLVAADPFFATRRDRIPEPSSVSPHKSELLQAAEAGCEFGRYRSVSRLVRCAATARMPLRPSFASASGL